MGKEKEVKVLRIEELSELIKSQKGDFIISVDLEEEGNE